MACWDQVVPERTNTYAAPWLEFLSSAPTTAVVPVDRHREAEVVAGGGVGGGRLRPAGTRPFRCTNTYAAPVPEFVGAPDHRGRARERHRGAEVVVRAASEAVSLACWGQAVPERTNTYAAPVLESLFGAPTSAVVAGDRHRGSRMVAGGAVGGGQLGLLGPGRPRPHEHIRRPGARILAGGAYPPPMDPEIATEVPK